MIGWQWLLPEIDPRFIVLHDSLLPRFRGFSPSVTALILGENRLGVTAFKPDSGIDTGLICGQKEILVHYPVTIREIYARLAVAYVELVRQIIAEFATGSLKFHPQNAEKATYSLWRDEADYQINWNSSASSIVRFVDALGYPYLGAKTTLQGREIRIDRVEVTSDVVFECRQPGKIWSMTNNVPTVVCGSGMLKILEAREIEGGAVYFGSLRVRLGI
jgi:methionyl-tRNA formyltransferase